MKYVIYGSKFRPNLKVLADYEKCKNTIYIKQEDLLKIKSKLLYRIFMSHMYGKLSFIPLKQLWRFLIEIPKISIEEKVIFIYYEAYQAYFFSGAIKYIKSKYKNSIHIARTLDIHNFKREYNQNFMNDFDAEIFYHKKTAEKYGVKYFHMCSSKISLTEEMESPYYDIFFVGQAKNRLLDLINLFQWCKQNKIIAKFYIIGVPIADRLCSDEINYVDFVSDELYMKLLLHSNCLVDFQYPDSDAYTIRAIETVVYNKRMITNNKAIKNEEFYNENNFFIFDSYDDINPEFVKTKPSYREKDYAYEYSPIRFLEYLGKEYENIFAESKRNNR